MTTLSVDGSVALCDGGDCGYPCTKCGEAYGGKCDPEEPQCRDGERRCNCAEQNAKRAAKSKPDLAPFTSPGVIDVVPYPNPADHWIETFAESLAVEPFDLKHEQISIYDIAHSLANVCRYMGHSRDFYSVATHSLAVMKLAEHYGERPAVQLWALLHDASEAYLGDVATPLKRHPIFAAYCKLEEEVQIRIRSRFSLHTLTPAELTRVAGYDGALLLPERVALKRMPSPRTWNSPNVEGAPAAFKWARNLVAARTNCPGSDWGVQETAAREYVQNFYRLGYKAAAGML